MKSLAALLLLAVAPHVFAAPVPKGTVPVIDLRDADGKVLLAADDLERYDWDTHTLAVKDGAKGRLLKALGEAGRFAVCIDGKPAFTGRHYSAFTSEEHDGPVIVTPEGRAASPTELHIRAAYPDDRSARSGDRRDVTALKVALEKAGKLTGAKK